MKEQEIVRLETEQRVKKRYLEEMEKCERSSSAIIQEIANDEGYTLEGIRRMLIRHEVYQTNKSTDNNDDNNETER